MYLFDEVSFRMNEILCIQLCNIFVQIIVVLEVMFDLWNGDWFIDGID